MLCLAHEVGGNELRVSRVVCHDKNFARTRDHVNVHDAVEELLGSRNEDVARPYDLIDLRDLLRSVGKRGDRLCAAGEEHSVHAADRRSDQNILVRGAVLAGRCHHDDLLDAGNFRGNGVHQHARRIRRRAARNVQSHTLQAAHTLSENDTVRLCVSEALRLLAVVEVGNVLLRVQERIHEFLVCRGQGIVDDLAGHLIILRQIAVKFLGVRLDRFIAALADSVDDLGDDLRHLAVGLAAALGKLLQEIILGFAVAFNLSNH